MHTLYLHCLQHVKPGHPVRSDEIDPSFAGELPKGSDNPLSVVKSECNDMYCHGWVELLGEAIF